MDYLKNRIVKIAIKTLGKMIGKGWITEDRAFQLLQDLPISDATIFQLFAEPQKSAPFYDSRIPRCLSKYYQKINQR